jgi:hypothetical protein
MTLVLFWTAISGDIGYSQRSVELLLTAARVYSSTSDVQAVELT